MRDALGVAAGINEFLRQSDIIYMANYAQTVNVIGAIKTTDNHAVMAATGQALKMYRQYFGSIPVGLTGDQRPLDIAAAVTPDHKHLTVSIVNLSWDDYEVPLSFEGSERFSRVEMIAMRGQSDMAYNVPGQELSVTVSEPEVIEFKGKLNIEPVEARIYRFEMKK
jgi:alpha-N-arabinofuranosidase